MQNWNQWQLSAGAVATSMPQPPVGYAAPGADPMAMMQAYMQYYNQPAPSGYTAEQWAAAQQQSWSQWQQWQQQYQQWQAQYGEKYQETMKQMTAQNMNLANRVPQLPIAQPPPPLPKEDSKPPLPPSTLNTYQFTNMPPPHQNNLPLFPAKQTANTTMQTSVQNCSQNPPLPPNQPPLPPDSSNSTSESNLNGKRVSSTVSESNSAKRFKVEDEELTEAEKTFDAQFKQWEEQFNKWKQQNANHPDKTQYKQYEAKWTSWREKLIERREQMRRKREQQKQAAAKAESEKAKSLPGDDKIMNILSSTENQGLINNLLGIGKTLGLTGKQNASIPPPPPPPPATETVTSNVQTSTMTSASQATSQSSASQLPVMNMMSSNVMTSSSWNSQQWTPQYNAGVNVSTFPNFQPMTNVPPPPFGAPPTQMPPPNFTQPPPNFTNVPNFSQPPPGFPVNDTRQNHNVRPPILPNMQNRPPLFGSNNGNGPDGNLVHNDRSGQTGPPNNFDSMNHSTNFAMNDTNRQKDGAPPDRFARDGVNNQQNNQFRPNDLYNPQNDERAAETEQFRREDRNYQEQGNNQFNQQKMNFSNDRYVGGNERFAPGNNRFGSGNDRFGSGNDVFGPGDNRFATGNDRFGPNNDRFGPNNESFGPGGDRFNRNNLDSFDQKDGDNRRDVFPNAPRNFNRNNQFEPQDKFAPELKKLMEKRRAAMDVFKPSYLDSEKSCNVGSLSESFKKITGDSLFTKGPTGNNAFGPRGSSNFGPGGPGNFRMPGDFKPQGGPEFGPRGPEFGPRGPEFGPRCPVGIGRNNSFDSRDLGVFKGPIPSPHQPQDFGNIESRLKENLENVSDLNKEIKNEPSNVLGKIEETATEQNADNVHKDQVQNDIPLLEKPPWIDTQVSEGNSSQMDENNKKDDENASTSYNNSSEKDGQNVNIEQTEEKQDVSSNDNDSVNKKIDALPFMGENDPKPEDLNMEPPPELPNLCAVSADTNAHGDPMRRNDEQFDPKESSLKPFPSNAECFDPRSTSDISHGPRGMQFRPNAPFLGLRNDARFPMFEPRGPNTFAFNSPGPNHFPLGPRAPNDGQFVPRGPNDGQFGPRGGPNNGQFGPRGSNDGTLFGPRGPVDGQFGLRGPNNGQFGPRGPNFGQFGPRYPNDGQLGPPRRPNEARFGPRGPNDGQFGPPGPNRQFAPAPFDNRGPGEGPPRFPGPNDRLFGSRRNEGPYQQNPSGPKGQNDGCFGPPAPNDQYYGSRGPVVDNQFDNKAPGDFRGQIDNNSNVRIPENPEAGDSKICGDGGLNAEKSLPFDANNQMHMEPSIQQGQFDSKDMQNPAWRQTHSSKNCFGDIDQRSGRDFGYINKSFNQPSNIESSLSVAKSNIPDKRSEKTMNDLSFGETSSGSDFGKFGNSNMYTKRPLDNRQSQVRCPTGKEFCIEKQFNYNHAGATSDKKFIEHVPAKVIDYSHTSRSTIQDHLTPVQCFDYGHGNLKPVVPEHEIYPKKDFRNWEENEQNLKEYTDTLRNYEYYAGKTESRRSGDYSHRRDSQELIDARKSERNRRERVDFKEKEREDRMFESISDKDQDNRYDKNVNKERTRERCETSQKETNKENEKEEDRSKGNINWQESSNKNVVETKQPDTSVTDVQHNVLEPAPKTLELAKTPNCTMVDDLLCPPGRQNRPPKIAIILRGPPGSGKSFVAKLIKDKEVEQGGSAPRILSLDDYFLAEKEIESTDDNGKKVTVKEMVYEYEEAMEQSYTTSLIKAFKKNITDGFFNFIILDCINEKISDYEEMWSFAKTKGFKVYVCEMEMDLQICLKRNVHNRTEDEINRIIDYFEPTPSYHQKLDVNSMLQEQAIEEVHMEDSEETQEKSPQQNEDSQDSQEDIQDTIGVSKWERMEAEDKLDRLDGLAKKKNEGKVQTMKDFLQVPDYYNMEDTSGKKRVRWADLEERKEQEKMRAVGFVVGHTNWDRMMDPTKGGSALTRTKFFSLS